MTQEPTGKSEREAQAEKNMAKVREAMQMHQKVAQGSKLTHEVPIDYLSTAIDPNTGERIHYKGVVVFKKPSTADLMRMGGLKSQFLQLGGVTNLNLVDNGIKFLAHVMATLSVVVQKRPEWLAKPTEMDDTDILYHVFDKYEEWESQFRHSFQGATTTDSEASEGEETVDSP